MFQTKPKMRFPQFAQKLLQLRALARTKEQEARRRKEGGILVFQRTLKSRVSIDQPEPFFVQREKEGQAAKPDKENGEKVRFWTKLICKSLDSFVELIRDNWRNDHWVNWSLGGWFSYWLNWWEANRLASASLKYYWESIGHTIGLKSVEIFWRLDFYNQVHNLPKYSSQSLH